MIVRGTGDPGLALVRLGLATGLKNERLLLLISVGAISIFCIERAPSPSEKIIVDILYYKGKEERVQPLVICHLVICHHLFGLIVPF